MSNPKNTETTIFFGGSLLILIAAILLGTTGTSQALAPVGSSPQEIGALRLLVGGGTLMLFAAALSYYFFCRGLERVAVFSAVTLSLSEPLTATQLGILVVGERFTPTVCSECHSYLLD